MIFLVDDAKVLQGALSQNPILAEMRITCLGLKF
jgi:hypothetical protein